MHCGRHRPDRFDTFFGSASYIFFPWMGEVPRELPTGLELERGFGWFEETAWFYGSSLQHGVNASQRGGHSDRQALRCYHGMG